MPSQQNGQMVGKLATNCLSVFNHFVGLALKGTASLISQYQLALWSFKHLNKSWLWNLNHNNLFNSYHTKTWGKQFNSLLFHDHHIEISQLIYCVMKIGRIFFWAQGRPSGWIFSRGGGKIRGVDLSCAD